MSTSKSLHKFVPLIVVLLPVTCIGLYLANPDVRNAELYEFSADGVIDDYQEFGSTSHKTMVLEDPVIGISKEGVVVQETTFIGGEAMPDGWNALTRDEKRLGVSGPAVGSSTSIRTKNLILDSTVLRPGARFKKVMFSRECTIDGRVYKMY